MKFFIKTPALFLIAFFSFVSCKKEITGNAPVIVPPVENNNPPVAWSGADQTITLPVNSVTIDGSGSSDADGSIIAYSWRQIAGPNESVIGSPFQASSKVNDLSEGVFKFELKVTDNRGLPSFDTVVVTVVSLRPIINLQLTPVGALSIERYEVASASIGNKIFYAGGYKQTSQGSYIVFSRIDIYDVSTQQWSTKELSEARTSIGAVTVGNKILFAGGETDFDPWEYTTLTTRVDIYDASTDSWTTTELPNLMEFGTGQKGIAVAAGNKAFFCGGDRRDVVYIYDVVSNSWSTDNLSVARGDFAAASLGNKLLIAGVSLTPNVVDVYDIGTGIWSVTNLSEGRQYLKAASHDSRVFFAGGGLSPQFTNVVDIYNNATQSWSIASLNIPTTLYGIAPFGQMLLFFGRFGVDIYDAATNTWSTANNPNFSDLSLFNSAGGNIYATIGNEVWRVEL